MVSSINIMKSQAYKMQVGRNNVKKQNSGEGSTPFLRGSTVLPHGKAEKKAAVASAVPECYKEACMHCTLPARYASTAEEVTQKRKQAVSDDRGHISSEH
ncbi:hypothetical protein Anapl_00159 [Anas platyrhynchos]|uniref:Uncharacterized protein n=1 Tax=Anas platyrhynchos TaxID=8839 RepID=R0K2D1_ANAPL|nr:hypothetical protein Anapl_00159 [Anas platyrhynchos]